MLVGVCLNVSVCGWMEGRKNINPERVRAVAYTRAKIYAYIHTRVRTHTRALT